MKKRVISFIVLAVAALFFIAGCGAAGTVFEKDGIPKGVCGTGPVTYFGELQVNGNRIYGARTNDIAQIRGMSFFWGNTGWGQEKYWTADMVKYLVNDLHVEVVRASMGVEDPGAYIEDLSNDVTDNLDRLEVVVNAAIANDIFVIIDWHSHYAFNYTEEAKEFFEYVAKKYGQYDNVIFEIFNEPAWKEEHSPEPWTTGLVEWPLVKEYSEQVIPVIRRYSDNLIIVGNPIWSQAVNNCADDPITGWDNLAYALHFYVPNHGANVAKNVHYAMEKGNIAIFASEWGFWVEEPWGEKEGFNEADWMAIFDQYDISWCNWAVSDKEEVPSLFKPGFTLEDQSAGFTESGTYIKGKFLEYAPDAEWRMQVSN